MNLSSKSQKAQFHISTLLTTMWRLTNSLLLLTSLGCAARCSQDPGMVYDFDSVSSELCPNIVMLDLRIF
jgi:hypothetical protein